MLVTGAAFAQTAPKLTFEVASFKPAAPLDMAKMQAAMAAGEAPKIGMKVDAARVEFTYMDLKTLVSIAYKLKPYQVTGPAWIGAERYDIIAKMPDGATKDDIPQMLEALLKERLKLDAHLESKEHPVLGLVLGKGGPKLKESEGVPVAIDESAPLKEGEMKMDTPDGPVRMKVDPKTGGGTVNMGAKGTMAFHMSGAPAGGAPTPADMANMTLHMDGKQMTMAGFVEMLGQFSSQMNQGSGRQIVDLTGLKGHYDVSLDISMADLLAMARAQGYDVPGMPGGGGGSPQAASDPSGTAGLFGSVQALGLKLEPRKAVVDQIVVDHAEKVPTAN